MPSLKIIINPYTGENSFYKNQSRIGSKSRSPFRNLTDSSIFGWIYKLPSLAESEMNDKYDMVVSAPEFETAIIRLLMKGQALCSSFREEPFEVQQSVSERLEVATLLQEKYATRNSEDPVHKEIIDEESNEGSVRIKLGKIQLDIIGNAQESIDFTNNGIVWNTPDTKEVVGIIRSRFCDVPSLLNICNSLSECRGQMSDVDRDAYDSLFLTEPCVVPSIESEIEVGKASVIDIKIIPQSAKCPELKITADNPAFIISGHTITACDVAQGVVMVSRIDSPENIVALNVHSFRHHTVSSIKLSVNSNVMESGSQQVVTAAVEPSDAEDADKLTIVSDSLDILKIVNGRFIEGIKPGNGIIVASCGSCSDRIQIDVLPKMESIKLDIEEDKEFRVGECMNAKLVVSPQNAFRHNVVVESSDSYILSIEKHIDNEYHIKAKCIGNCEIIIKDENGVVLSRQLTHVISTLYKKKKPSYTAFIGLASLLVCIYLALQHLDVPDFVFLILLIGSLLLSLWSIFKEKRHYLTSIIVAGAVIWLLGYAVLTEIRERNSKAETTEIQQTTIDNGNRK